MPPKFKRSVSREDLYTADDVEKETLLDHDSDVDEAMVFNRPSTSGSYGKSTDVKMDSVRVQIKEVTDVMRENVEKVMERGERMEDLQVASERLIMAGNAFHDTAKKARRRAWLQNMRTRIIIGVVVMAIILIIVGTVIKSYS